MRKFPLLASGPTIGRSGRGGARGTKRGRTGDPYAPMETWK